MLSGDAEKGGRTLHLMDGAIIDGFLYFSSMEYNGLFRWNIYTGKTEFLMLFQEELFSYNLYGHIVSDDKVLFFLPIHGSKISVYDTEKETLDTIDFFDTNMKSLHVTKAIFYKNHFLLIPPNLNDDFHYLDPKNKTVIKAERISLLVSEALATSKKKMCRFEGACLRDNYLYIAVLDDNVLLELDLASETIKKHVINGMVGNNVLFHNHSLWISSSDGRNAIRWRGDAGIKHYNIEKNNVETFSSFVPFKDTILILPWGGRRILRYDETSDSWIELWTDRNERNLSDKGRPLYCGWCILDDALYLFPCMGQGILKINMCDDYAEQIPLVLDDEQTRLYNIKKTEAVIKNKKRSNRILHEMGEENIALSDFISFLGGTEVK